MKTISALVFLLLLPLTAVGQITPLEDDVLSGIQGQSMAFIIENFKLDSPVSASLHDTTNGTATPLGSAELPSNYQTNSNGYTCPYGAMPGSGALRTTSSCTRTSVQRGWSWEMVNVDEPGASYIPAGDPQGVGRVRMVNMEIGDLDDTNDAANFFRFGNSMWDDPLDMAIKNNTITITMPGNYEYGAGVGDLKGPDVLPSNGFNGKLRYGFVAPDVDVGFNAGGFPDKMETNLQGCPYNTTGSNPVPLAHAQCIGMYTFKNKGEVYHAPHLDGKAGYSFSNWPTRPNNSDYTVTELASIENFDVQFEMYASAPVREGFALGNHPRSKLANRNAGVITSNVAGFYNPSGGGDATICCKSDPTNGVHRVASVRITGIHSGMTATPSYSNPGGRNVVMLRPGGYAKALYLPDFNCFGATYKADRPGSNLVANCGGSTNISDYSREFVGTRLDYNIGTHLDTSSGTSTTTDANSYFEPWVRNADNDQINPGSALTPEITQDDIKTTGCTAEGPGCRPFNAYPRGHADYARKGSAGGGNDGDVSNDTPNLRGGFRGILELNYLRIDDIRLARTRSVSTTNAAWGASPQDVLDNLGTGNSGNYDVVNRELWITDLEIRDLRLGTLMTNDQYKYLVDNDTNGAKYNPHGLWYPDAGDLGAGSNEVAPLSITFFDDPYHGRVLELFMPYHNASVAGNGEGRISFYMPFIAPTANGQGQCCGATIIEGVQIDFLSAKLFLDPQE